MTDFVTVRSATQGIPKSHLARVVDAVLIEPPLVPDAEIHRVIGTGGMIEILDVDISKTSRKSDPDTSVMIADGLAAHDVLARFPDHASPIRLRLWLPALSLDGLAARGIQVRVIPGTLVVKSRWVQATADLVRPRTATERAEAETAAALTPAEVESITNRVRADAETQLRADLTAEVTVQVRREVAETAIAALSALLTPDDADSAPAAPPNTENATQDDFSDFEEHDPTEGAIK
ncbi:hypothetical protein [Gordonia tangerina]|uniref:Uncharacterized protein n=1 Tax=Gordonia tangerina TaxID=2911060 RepID=A0ABS9DH50_9ACTN|nr:hypothetical protein [Gordonia tangerina]MCF3937188.1 hypothetical protein [Gordonia tangerina]